MDGGNGSSSRIIEQPLHFSGNSEQAICLVFSDLQFCRYVSRIPARHEQAQNP
jgi:hypothetical protein